MKQPASSSGSPSEAPTGLVPASYIVPLEPLKTVTAIYDYTANAEEEISISENAVYSLYEDDGEWSLVALVNAKNGSKREVGFAPSAYLEEVRARVATVFSTERLN